MHKLGFLMENDEYWHSTCSSIALYEYLHVSSLIWLDEYLGYFTPIMRIDRYLYFMFIIRVDDYLQARGSIQ